MASSPLMKALAAIQRIWPASRQWKVGHVAYDRDLLLVLVRLISHGFRSTRVIREEILRRRPELEEATFGRPRVAFDEQAVTAALEKLREEQVIFWSKTDGAYYLAEETEERVEQSSKPATGATQVMVGSTVLEACLAAVEWCFDAGRVWKVTYPVKNQKLVGSFDRDFLAKVLRAMSVGPRTRTQAVAKAIASDGANLPLTTACTSRALHTMRGAGIVRYESPDDGRSITHGRWHLVDTRHFPCRRMRSPS